MTLLQDGILAFFSAVGMTTVVWMLAGALLHAGRPTVPGLMLLLPLRGEALAMENDVRELRRVQGRLPGAKIVLADCGMTEDARELAAYLAEREKNARMVLAEVEKDISSMLVEAADQYQDNEVALRLRTMHLLYESVRNSGGTVVIPSAYSEGFSDAALKDMANLANSKNGV